MKCVSDYALESHGQGVVCKIKALLNRPWKVEIMQIEIMQINHKSNGVDNRMAKLARGRDLKEWWFDTPTSILELAQLNNTLIV
ncbi:hypothetical protein V6N13_048789 [Hibiscus sabdariffa]|uniref:Uncharacterized protein n=1 Tax=Hibiscus sabdariffa TaxID=183260 RepID=A0ABR2DK73_9ROSI